MVPFGKHKITRLLLGSNTFNGYSYSLPSLDHHMREWFNTENVCQVLRSAEQNGINTYQFGYTPKLVSDLQRYHAEGGRLQWILLGSGPMTEDLSVVREMAKLGPLGIAHHGGVTDRRFHAGEMNKVRDYLKAVRDTGVMVGLSMHNPDVLIFVEEQNWDVDFYMTCFYNFSRTQEEARAMLGDLPLGRVFLQSDPARMCRVIRQTRKTCLGFKILAAGRLAESPRMLEQAFRFAFDNIKPQDAVIVGMYPRFKDEVKENTETAARVLTPAT